MRNLSKEFIVKNGDKTFKEVFPDFFNPFTGWAETSSEGNRKYLMFFKNGLIQYGFNGAGKWCENELKKYEFDHATESRASFKKVRQALIEEAKARGLYEAKYFKDVNNNRATYGEAIFRKTCEENSIWNIYGNIYSDGKWAELVDTMTIEEAQDKFNIVIR